MSLAPLLAKCAPNGQEATFWRPSKNCVMSTVPKKQPPTPASKASLQPSPIIRKQHSINRSLIGFLPRGQPAGERTSLVVSAAAIPHTLEAGGAGLSTAESPPVTARPQTPETQTAATAVLEKRSEHCESTPTHLNQLFQFHFCGGGAF